LRGAYLREANLRDCDLSGVTGGLHPRQLAGADLTGATLPEPLSKLFENLKAVEDISESAHKLFVAILAACLYSWLTIATTTDVNLITNRASSPLPIIQTSIPIVWFYVVTPVLLLCVNFYFHFYLQKLWEELGSLPAIFPDGRRLHERSDPWLLNDLVRSHVALLKPGRPFMSYFQQAISIVLAWWLVPLTLLLLWGRYLPRHDFYGTTFQVVLLAISITSAIFLRRLAGATLRGAERLSFSWWRGEMKNPRDYSGLAAFLATGAAFMLLSAGAIRGVPPSYWPWWRQGPLGCWGWVPRAMALVHYSPFANLRQADVSVKPPNWTRKNESELDLVKGAEVNGADLRYADLRGAFLVNALLSATRLEGADLQFSDLRQADLRGADLNRADLRGADLNRAVLDEAHLNGARLNNADLNGAHLNEAHLNRAVLDEAHLNGARLNFADLNEAHLDGAHLKGAHLHGAYLIAADLAAADLTFADLKSAHLDGAHLKGADLEFADFASSLPTKGLTAAALKTARHWDKAYYDDDLLQQLGLPPDHNKKLEEEQKRQEQRKGSPAVGTAAPNTQGATLEEAREIFGKPSGWSLSRPRTGGE
jgi:uncharacterized protein YjbI with pentapeptide repeats